MDMNQYMLFAIAIVLLGIRLPSVMNRLGMYKSEKITFVIFVFVIISIAWLIWQTIRTFA